MFIDSILSQADTKRKRGIADGNKKFVWFRSGEVLSLYPLLPNKMSVERDSNGVLYYVYSRYTDENPNMKKVGDIILRQEDVLHIPGLGFDGLIGYSPIAMARNAVGMTMACEEYGASFFANGANPGGVLEHPGVLKDPAKVRDSWNAVYCGTTNAHKIAVLEEGMKYQQIGIPPEEAQFLETRKFQINEIARLFRIPPHVETVVFLSQQKPDDYIKVELELDELDLTTAESKATYKEIQEYVLKEHGLKVSNLYISQVKRKCGILFARRKNSE